MNRIEGRFLHSKRQVYEGQGSSPSLKFKVTHLKYRAWKFPNWFLKLFLKSAGLFEQGRKNALDLRLENRVLNVQGLPEELEGLKILFLSDLHFGNELELTEIIVEKIHGIKVDLCLFGGDYQYYRSKSLEPTIEGMKKILSVVNASLGIFAVLGNHDTIELVPELEKMGVRTLMNESILLEKNSLPFYLVGVDDPFYFGFHDVEKAFRNVPDNSFNIFLSHTPDLYKDASEKGADFYLCGHTHHGQIQFPLYGPLFLHSQAPRELGLGEWSYKDMAGFTGPGVGTSGAPVRFRCSPEVTCLELRSSKNS
ncbi:MAG: metallophosphoesterase [Nitrospinae bacterium]|nr:metallophosphoesterase [Nitrospinota bacterium]